MNDDQNYFFYPENLSEKALFFGWTGINLVIIAVGLVLYPYLFLLFCLGSAVDNPAVYGVDFYNRQSITA